MRSTIGVLVFLLSSGCAMNAASRRAASPASVAAIAPTPAPASNPTPVVAVPEAPVASTERTTVNPNDEDDDDAGPSEEEGESHEAAGPDDGRLHYSNDLSDEALDQMWRANPENLGSISMGFVDEGRLINGQQFPKGDEWIVVTPERAWGTKETIDYVVAAIHRVREQYPDAPPLRVNQISAKEGGYLRPHKSHQSGRDVDLAFYYPGVEPIRARERERYIDVPKNWALLKALITQTDVQLVLVDRRVQKVLYDYALQQGEDRAWLDSLFHAGHHALIQHARRHRDHFHVRFFNARAQELGRRVAPLLAERPEHNLLMHRVHSGDTLGAIAARYGTTVDGLRKVNHLKGSMLHIAQVLRVPLHGPCTHCPIPPEVLVPERRLPPASEVRASNEMRPAELASAAHQTPATEPKPESASVTGSAPASSKEHNQFVRALRGVE